MADHHAAAHGSADDQYLETPPGAEYEHTDANAWIIVKFLVWLVISAVVIHVGLGFMYGFMIEQSKETGERQYPSGPTWVRLWRARHTSPNRAWQRKVLRRRDEAGM